MVMKEISDLGLIAGLITLGYSPTERRKEGRRVYFTFEWDDNMETLKTDYENHRMFGDFNTYQANLKSIKMAIYQMDKDA